MTTQAQAAKFFKMSLSGFKKWSAETRRRAILECEYDATPEIQKHIAELNRLAYVFDCKYVNGLEQVMECRINRVTWQQLSVSIYQGVSEVSTTTIDLQSCDVLRELIKVRTYLEGLIYGKAQNGQK